MINVTCAIILKEELILAVQRSAVMKHPLKWEFPGGKIEAGESAEDCICRELREELHIEVKVLSRLPAVEYHYGEKAIRLIPFEVGLLSENIVLREHSDYQWLQLHELHEPDWLQADVLVIDEYLREKK